MSEQYRKALERIKVWVAEELESPYPSFESWEVKILQEIVTEALKETDNE